MPRVRRFSEGGYVYRVLNRANARLRLFESDVDYERFPADRVQDDSRWLSAVGRNAKRAKRAGTVGVAFAYVRGSFRRISFFGGASITRRP